MKKFNQIFVLLLVFLIAFVLPVAVLAGKECMGEEKQQAPRTIFIEQDIDNETGEIDAEEAIEVDTDEEFEQGSQKAWVLQKKALIQDKIALTEGLEEAELRLEQFETEYEAVLSLGDPVEIDRLSAEITTEKSNVFIMKTHLKKTIDEIHRFQVFADPKWASKI